MAAQTAKNTTTSKDFSRANEIVAVILSALAVLIFLCLITYSPTDSSLNTSSSAPTQNWVGVVGAYIADILFQAVGLTAYFLPVLLGLAAWRFFRSKNLPTSFSRVFGFILFIISTAGLASLFGLTGGITGAFVAQTSEWLLGAIGAGILLLAIFATSLLLITSLSFVSLFSDFGMAWENFQIRFEPYFKGYKDWREKRNAEALERREKRREAREEDKPERKKPTIALGETLTDLKGKTETASEKVSSVFSRFEKSPEAQEATNGELKEEIAVPTISTSVEVHKEKPLDLVAEANKIPIQPIQETGELDADLLETKVDEDDFDEIKDDDETDFEEQEPQDFENYVLPESEFLTAPPPHIEQKDEELLAIAQDLTGKTKEFNVTGRVMHICQGPVVTTYEFKPDPGVKYSRVTSLSDDLCLALKAESIRIDRIPGKAVVGIEVPNKERETIFLREVVESAKFKNSNSLLTIALGKTINGSNYIADLAKMPHLLIAGATGAGKSVGVNSLVVSILYKAKPDEVKFIMVDPKRLELGLYADIPHLATPIITDPKRAAISLKWAVSEMERRYKDLAGWGVRNIDGYNQEVNRKKSASELDEEGNPYKNLPYIVIIIDELADLMMVSGKEVETSITRLAQMARAVGIHLVLATQRPSVDVITGLIKANFPSRISFRVSSKIDSRTILDTNGAEYLLGRGDMLFKPPQTSRILRVHGAYVDEKEIQKIVSHIKSQGNPEYDVTITKSEEELDDSGDLPGRNDELFADALRTVVGLKRASTSQLQRHLRIGYGRAAAILDALVAEGYIGEMDGSKRARPVLQKAYEALQEAEEGREI